MDLVTITSGIFLQQLRERQQQQRLLQEQLEQQIATPVTNTADNIVTSATAVTTSAGATVAAPTVFKIIYTAPASSVIYRNNIDNDSDDNGNNNSNVAMNIANNTSLITPKKNIPHHIMLKNLREKLRSPGGNYEARLLDQQPSFINGSIVKSRYWICSEPNHITAAAVAKTPTSYRHLIDLTSSNLCCTDIYTEQKYLCKIINEPFHKVQRAYFQLKQDADYCRSRIYGHQLIRGVHDIIPLPLSPQRTYVIIAMPNSKNNYTDNYDDDYDDEYDGPGGYYTPPPAKKIKQQTECTECAAGIYEDLHTYIRNKRRLNETEARALFQQICQTVQVCHRNGIILRDLKLKRFYFIDSARTKLQYESLEGSMILDNANDDTLSDKIGCPLYTAPELLCTTQTYQGKPADMWSLGVILYTMLVGQYPFYEKGNCNLITIIRHCHVQIPNSLSKSVRWLLLTLLRKNYEERIRIEHIFYVPWLKQQRPDYMSIPVDIIIPDDEDDKQEDNMLLQEEDGVQYMNEADYDRHATMKPLDYSRSGLQMETENDSDTDTDDEEDDDEDEDDGEDDDDDDEDNEHESDEYTDDSNIMGGTTIAPTNESNTA